MPPKKKNTKSQVKDAKKKNLAQKSSPSPSLSKSRTVSKGKSGSKVQPQIQSQQKRGATRNQKGKVEVKPVSDVQGPRGRRKAQVVDIAPQPIPKQSSKTPQKKQKKVGKSKKQTPQKPAIVKAAKEKEEKKEKQQEAKKPQKKQKVQKQKQSAENKSSKIETKPTSTDDQQIVKVITKGGAAVDSLVPGKQNYRVFQDSQKSYAATLNQANLDHNNNKFYIVQILLHQKTGALSLWNRWGRVGVSGQNCMKGPFSKDVAIKEFNSKVHEKTKKGDYKQIEIKYDDEDQKKESNEKKTKSLNNIESKMEAGLQRLLSLIFDVNILNNTMKEIGYDAKKMPLGKLGQNTIKLAYNALNSLTQAMKDGITSQYSKFSSEFYTLIPHDFGFHKMSKYILNNEEKVKEKLRMLQTISDMKITAKLLDQDVEEDISVHDQNYKKLGCSIKTLEKTSDDFKLLKEYFDNTKGSFSSVNIGDIYEVQRPTEVSLFNQSIGNNMLLWHGSRIANFVGILSQGLRIAPPEAPVSGYLFGKGIYLADMAEKSIHYCRSAGSAKALILLIEGAIGSPNILLTSSSQAKQLMQKNGRNSTKCHGSKAPPETCYVNHKGMIIPNGKAAATNSGSYMGHNEYIVYNMNQAKIRYIMEMNMND